MVPKPQPWIGLFCLLGGSGEAKAVDWPLLAESAKATHLSMTPDTKTPTASSLDLHLGSNARNEG